MERMVREPDRREKFGRGVGVLLFVAVLFLGGVFVGASLSDRRPQPGPSAPGVTSDAGRVPALQTATPPAPTVEPLPPAVAPALPTVSPAPAAAGPAKLTAAEIEALMARGDAQLRAGDVMAARALYQTCAVAGDGAAALRLGETFDPAYLDGADLRREYADLGQAAYWYRRSQELGSAEAAYRLREIEIAARSGWNGNIRLPAQPVQRRQRSD
jgi:hypothetical protein